MEASEPKWVNSDYIEYRVNSFRLAGIQLNYSILHVSIVFHFIENLINDEILYFIDIFSADFLDYAYTGGRRPKSPLTENDPQILDNTSKKSNSGVPTTKDDDNSSLYYDYDYYSDEFNDTVVVAASEDDDYYYYDDDYYYYDDEDDLVLPHNNAIHEGKDPLSSNEEDSERILQQPFEVKGNVMTASYGN